jgi:hypothetical protein
LLGSNAGRFRHNGDIELAANAVGGTGGGSPDLRGGNGGGAIGGTVTVLASGTGEIASTGLSLTAEASSGDGADGGDAATGGAGGAGNDATGGRATLATTGAGRISVSGSTIAFARGFGGFGGSGGNGSNVGNTGGAGGDGGLGTGGRTEIAIAGGTVQLGQVRFRSDGDGGIGGPGGFGAGSPSVRAGNGGLGGGQGGTVTIDVADGASGEVGRLAAGNTFLRADGTIAEGADRAGSISIRETAAADDGTLVFANLETSAVGQNRPTGTGFSFTTDGGRTRILGQLTVVTDLDGRSHRTATGASKSAAMSTCSSGASSASFRTWRQRTSDLGG